jgi:hypothetical protein
LIEVHIEFPPEEYRVVAAAAVVITTARVKSGVVGVALDAIANTALCSAGWPSKPFMNHTANKSTRMSNPRCKEAIYVSLSI